VGRTGRLGAYRIRAMRTFLATQRDWPVTERLPAYAPELNPVEGLWSNLKGQELANLACDSLGEVVQATWQGIERVRQAWWLPCSFLRRAGLSVS
jgi:transposase